MRANRLALILLVGFSVVLFNLILMQVFRGDYYRSLSEKNRIRVIYLEAPRGKIVDRNNEILGSNRLSFNCSVIPREAKRHIRQSCQIVAGILGLNADDLEKRYRRKKQGAFNTVLLAEDIAPAQAIAIEEKLDFIPGFLIETRPQREYPYRESAAHLTGFIGPKREEGKDTLEFYCYLKNLLCLH